MTSYRAQVRIESRDKDDRTFAPTQAPQFPEPAAGRTPELFGVRELPRSAPTPDFADITFHEVLAKSALNKIPSSSTMPFSWTVNPYRGCPRVCIYCFARAAHSYFDLISGGDFARRVLAKVNAPDVLAAEDLKAEISMSSASTKTRCSSRSNLPLRRLLHSWPR